MSTIRVSRRSATRVLSMVASVLACRPADYDADHHRAVDELRSALKPKLRKPWSTGKAKKKAKKASKRTETSAIYEAATKRADGKCEACGQQFGFADGRELDHQFGRGKVRQSVANCWMIHRSCHRAKGYGYPSAMHWWHRIMSHAQKYGYAKEAAAAGAKYEAESIMEAIPLP